MSGSLFLGLLRGVDIRTLGSGNAGGTNALRTQGKWFALGVMIIDVGKGALAVLWLPAVTLPGVPLDANLARDFLTYALGLGVVLGHVYPLWFAFRGGKGAATAVGVLGVLAPQLVAPLVLMWLAIIVTTGYVGLATMCAAVAAALYLGVTDLPEEQGLFVFAVLLAALIVFTHRSNLSRMRDGTEARFGRLVHFRRGG